MRGAGGGGEVGSRGVPLGTGTKQLGQRLTKTNFIQLKSIRRAIFAEECLEDLFFGLAYSITIKNID